MSELTNYIRELLRIKWNKSTWMKFLLSLKNHMQFNVGIYLKQDIFLYDKYLIWKVHLLKLCDNKYVILEDEGKFEKISYLLST